MRRPTTDSPRWAMVDEGWGRKAVDFATLSELGNCREYVAVHHRLGVDAGDRLLDVACGSGLAIELARLRGASCSGIDASARLVAVARDRNPGCDIRVGDVERLDVPFAWEFADPDLSARALAATGPAYEAIQNVGEAEFHPRLWSRLRGSYATACRCGPRSTSWATWPVNPKEQNAHDRQLSRRTRGVPPSSGALRRRPRRRRLRVERVPAVAHQPGTLTRLFGLMSEALTPSGLAFRQRGILVTAAASALGDSYCSLAWGGKLGQASDAAVAAGVLTSSDAGLTDQEKVMAAWARKVARDPNATTPADIQALRDSGLDDGQIFAITAFVAPRLAFSAINDSLGAQPDAQLAQSLPREVREAVTYGRPVTQAAAV